MNKWVGIGVALALMPFASLVSIEALAAQDELALLESYVGNWQGEGALVGGDEPEPFRCRLAIAKGNAGKVNYTGRCALDQRHHCL